MMQSYKFLRVDIITVFFIQSILTMLAILSNKLRNFLIVPLSKVHAASLSGSLSGELTNDSLNQVTNEKSFVQWVINISIPLGVTCAFGLLVYAGFMMLTSSGNPEKLKESREVITNAIIGFVVIMLSVTLLYLIKDTIGLEF